MTVETFSIEGMNCGHCAALVKKSLEMVKGVESAEVAVGSATVAYDEKMTTHERLEEAITRFGYRIAA